MYYIILFIIFVLCFNRISYRCLKSCVMSKKKLTILLLSIIVITSCTNDYMGNYKPEGKEPSEAAQKLPVAANFDWKTMKNEPVEITTPASVYEVNDGQEVLIAENLPEGTYTLTHVNANGKFVVRPVTAPVVYDRNRSAMRGDAVKSIYYFPSSTGWGMMMVEDVFPYLGDLDLNDIVFKFRIKYELGQTGGSGKSPHVRAIEFNLIPLAMGGSKYDKIGVALNFIQDKVKKNLIKSVSGQINKGTGMIGNETENVVFLTDDLRSQFIGSKTEFDIINTFTTVPSLVSEPFTVRLELTPGLSRLNEVLPVPDENGNMLDLFVTLGERGREVHVKGHPATAKLNADLEKYSSYVSAENWVWALILPDNIKYPKEMTPIYEAYPLFKDWVQGKLGSIDEWTFNLDHDKVYM